jgi:hypothetical protein
MLRKVKVEGFSDTIRKDQNTDFPLDLGIPNYIAIGVLLNGWMGKRSIWSYGTVN